MSCRRAAKGTKISARRAEPMRAAVSAARADHTKLRPQTPFRGKRSTDIHPQQKPLRAFRMQEGKTAICLSRSEKARPRLQKG